MIGNAGGRTGGRAPASAWPRQAPHMGVEGAGPNPSDIQTNPATCLVRTNRRHAHSKRAGRLGLVTSWRSNHAAHRFEQTPMRAVGAGAPVRHSPQPAAVCHANEPRYPGPQRAVRPLPDWRANEPDRMSVPNDPARAGWTNTSRCMLREGRSARRAPREHSDSRTACLLPNEPGGAPFADVGVGPVRTNPATSRPTNPAMVCGPTADGAKVPSPRVRTNPAAGVRPNEPGRARCQRTRRRWPLTAWPRRPTLEAF
jgi:hypothetical protein